MEPDYFLKERLLSPGVGFLVFALGAVFAVPHLSSNLATAGAIAGVALLIATVAVWMGLGSSRLLGELLSDGRPQLTLVGPRGVRFRFAGPFEARFGARPQFMVLTAEAHAASELLYGRSNPTSVWCELRAEGELLVRFRGVLPVSVDPPEWLPFDVVATGVPGHGEWSLPAPLRVFQALRARSRPAAAARRGR